MKPNTYFLFVNSQGILHPQFDSRLLFFNSSALEAIISFIEIQLNINIAIVLNDPIVEVMSIDDIKKIMNMYSPELKNRIFSFILPSKDYKKSSHKYYDCLIWINEHYPSHKWVALDSNTYGYLYGNQTPSNFCQISDYKGVQIKHLQQLYQIFFSLTHPQHYLTQLFFNDFN